MLRLVSSSALFGVLLLLFVSAGCTSEIPLPETTQAVQDTLNQPERWSAYVIVPDGEDMVFYAYWLELDGLFAFRRLDAPPPTGPSGIPLPPDSTGSETVVSANAIIAMARAIQGSESHDRAIQEDASQSGYSLRDGRVRLFASRSFAVRSIVELLVVLGFLSIGGGILLTVVRRLRREQAARREAIEARSRMIRVREAERAVLAREIHDGPIQDLYALRLQAHAALLTQEAAQEFALEGELQKVSQELRSIMEGLRPPALDRFGFTAALESHAARASAGNDVIEVEVSEEAERILSGSDEDLQLGVFRVVQEALSNAVQHGNGRVEVAVTVTDTTIEASISDDGKGFGLNAIPSSDALMAAGHYGMVGMRERAEVMGGDLEFGTSPSGGVKVTLRVPIPTIILAR